MDLTCTMQRASPCTAMMARVAWWVMALVSAATHPNELLDSRCGNGVQAVPRCANETHAVLVSCNDARAVSR
jgi:hypothetical protein